MEELVYSNQRLKRNIHIVYTGINQYVLLVYTILYRLSNLLESMSSGAVERVCVWFVLCLSELVAVALALSDKWWLSERTVYCVRWQPLQLNRTHHELCFIQFVRFG